MMQEEDVKAASDPKHVKKIEKLESKLEDLKEKQPSHSIG